MNLPLSSDDGHTLLLVAGLGAIVGVMFGGWVMGLLHKLLMTLLKFTLLGAVVVIGLALWNGYQAQQNTTVAPRQSAEDQPTTQSVPPREYQTPDRQPARSRWWEQ